ncbi:MAG: Crp/Fnr family transcriptional regulator [Clostridiales bacterium]|nr:Crp/Fnr family transcriptional regulator [Clostridiales bacterium]
MIGAIQVKGKPVDISPAEKNALQILKNSALFSGLSEGELVELLPFFKPVLKNYARENIIIEEGDPVSQIGFVVRGRIVARKMTGGGHIHILAMHETGDVFGFDGVFSSLGTSPLTFTADTDCTALFISSSCFFGHRSRAGMRLLENASQMLADKCVRLLYKADVLSKKSLRERILTYFGILTTKSQSNAFTLKMSREQLAQYLCVNRSALSRELSRMQKEGIIKMKPEGLVFINPKKA